MIKFLSHKSLRVHKLLAAFALLLGVIAVAVSASRFVDGSGWHGIIAVVLVVILVPLHIVMWRHIYRIYESELDLETVQQDQSPFHDN